MEYAILYSHDKNQGIVEMNGKKVALEIMRDMSHNGVAEIALFRKPPEGKQPKLIKWMGIIATEVDNDDK